MLGDLGVLELLLMASIALLLLGASRFPRAAPTGAVSTDTVAGRAYLDRLFGPAPAPAAASVKRYDPVGLPPR